ncbi:MAG TPA: efflux RND transporter periplasmic adaptor subunit, partial [Polyangiaceae bacterium]|nr:efflux RND transporter periplasmic adaptor subunit [Polyangiaceae bacterium]
MTSPEHSRTPLSVPQRAPRIPPAQESVHPAADDLGFDLPEPAHVSRGRLFTVGAVGVALLAAAFLFGYLPKHRAKAELVEGARTEAEQAPRVEVVSPKISSSDRAIVLSGSVRALEE